MKHSAAACVLGACVSLASSGDANAAGAASQSADVFGQGLLGDVVSVDGGRLIRTKNGVIVAVSMPTPEPDTYMYPDGNAFQPTVLHGAPEVFTGWAFVFNRPDLCSDPCNGDDIGADKPALGGVYNFAGHIAGGEKLELDGHISVGDTPFVGMPLVNPMGAEVHAAIAPHGTLQPDLLPTQITTPIGDPSLWWLAIFEPTP